jgi:replication-associated recombination protein RarA
MPSNNAEQYKFGKDGQLEEPDDEEDDDPALNDWGEPLGRFGTKCGKSMFLVSSALQKAVRRSDEQRAAAYSYELVRSGYHGHLWKRLRTMCLEDIASHDPVMLLVLRYEELAEDFGKTDWGGEVAAISAAIALARNGESSREADWARWWFQTVAEERVKDDANEKYSYPGIPDEAHDKHVSSSRSKDRDMGHFVLHSSRVTSETDIGQEWKRMILEHEDFTDEPEEIEQAVANIEPGQHDDPPEDQNQSLSECGADSSDG